MTDLGVVLGDLPLSQLFDMVVLVLVAGLVITNKLVWHTRLREESERADRWEQIAVEQMQSAKAVVAVAETTAKIVSALPDPHRTASGTLEDKV